MLSPSDNLKMLLSELHLCTPQQLTSCEPEVRRLAGDLPGFDSCWLDVLVAHRLLTPWQAQCLQSANPRAMRQGHYRLREPLGRRTWQAETLDRSRILVLIRLPAENDESGDRQGDRAQQLIDAASETRVSELPHVCLPREYVSHETESGGWVASPFVPGWQMDELLIRGGRLPWQVVAEIGRGALEGIRELEQSDLVHGDLSLRNLRLQPDGQAVLVDPFTARLLRPTVGFRADLQLREIQHCAPERIGTGRRHDSVSDLYSLGCVLWQLLTARPRFISADPVRFLMHCRDQEVEDVRRWVPDCPPDLAHGIQLLTRRRAELRPQSASAALESWKQFTTSGVSATRSMLRRLPDRRKMKVARRPTLRNRRLVRSAWATAALTGCVMIGLSSRLVPLPLNLTRTTVTVTPPDSPGALTEIDVPPGPVDEVLQLPDVTPDGVVQLTAGRTYLARGLQRPGTLRIRTKGEGMAVVLVPPETGWNIRADQLQLSALQIRDQREPAASAHELLTVHSQLLEMDQVVVGQQDQRRATGLRWSSINDGSTVARISNSVILAGRFGIHTTSSPDRFVLNNVLFDAVETAWRCDTGVSSRVRLNMARVTQLGGSSFADVVSSGGSDSPSIEISCGESVLTPKEALVRLASLDPDWTADRAHVAFRLPTRSNPVIVHPAAASVVWFDRSLGQKVALADAQIVSESLLMAEPEFDSSDSATHSFASARMTDFDGPKRGTQLPGVDVTALPHLPETAAVAGGN